MAAAQQVMMMAQNGSPMGSLSATMTLAGVSGTVTGWNVALGIGSVSSAALSGGYTLGGISDDSAGNLFRLTTNVAGANATLTQNSFTSITINGNTFLASSATFINGGSTQPQWSWGNGGVTQSGTGRAFVIA